MDYRWIIDGLSYEEERTFCSNKNAVLSRKPIIISRYLTFDEPRKTFQNLQMSREFSNFASDFALRRQEVLYGKSLAASFVSRHRRLLLAATRQTIRKQEN
jgi:hypothetical protein